MGVATLDDYLQLFDSASEIISRNTENVNGINYHPGVTGMLAF